MAEISLAIEKITGKASADTVCGVFSSKVTVGEVESGTLVSCILTRGESANVDALRDFFEIAQKKLEGAEGGILKALVATLEPTKSAYGGLDVSLVHAFFVEDVCYIVRLGTEVGVWLFDPPNSAQITFESGSGPVSAGQLYLIATEAFLSIFDTSPLAEAEEVDLREVIDGVATEIAGEENQSEVGAVFIKVKNVEGEEETREMIGQQEEKGEMKGEEEVGKEEEVKIEEKGNVVYEIHKGEKVSLLSKIVRPFLMEINNIKRGDIGAIRRNIVAVAVIIVLVLAISGGFALYKKSEREKISQFNQHLSVASSKYSEAVAIMELNKNRAREILIEADREVKLALSIRGNDEAGKKLAGDIETKLKETEIVSDVKFEEVARAGDALKSLGQTSDSLVGISGDQLYVVDITSPDVKSGDVEKIVTGGSVAVGIVFDSSAYLATNSKVYRVDLADAKSVDVGEISGARDIGIFFGNVYILSDDSITKFVPIEAGYSGGSEYLSSVQTFTDKSHMAIDGSIWVTNGREILKFTRGEKESFEISGLVGTTGEFSLIYTTAGLDDLYVVDFVNSALLVIGKDGVYKQVLSSAEFSRASDLLVSEGGQKVYISVGDKILSTTLSE